MECCGKKRKQIRNKEKPLAKSTIIFIYIGRTALMAIGGATGRRYYFEFPGARLVVDPRDRFSLATVPMLRQLK